MSDQKQQPSPTPIATDKPRKHPRGVDGKFYGYPKPKKEPGQKQEGDMGKKKGGKGGGGCK